MIIFRLFKKFVKSKFKNDWKMTHLYRTRILLNNLCVVSFCDNILLLDYFLIEFFNNQLFQMVFERFQNTLVFAIKRGFIEIRINVNDSNVIEHINWNY